MKKRIFLQYFTRESKIFDSKKISEIADAVFDHDEKNKILYIREDPKDVNYYYYKLKFYERFSFCSREVMEFCHAIGSDGDALDESNPYFNKFKI
jgi:hypothetical protein